MKKRSSWIRLALVLFLVGSLGLFIITWQALMPLPKSLGLSTLNTVEHIPVLASDGSLLTESFHGPINQEVMVDLSEVPLLLREAFVFAEDRRFWDHQGVDWWARLAALRSNLKSQRVVRGASTIAQQSVRLIQPRPRTYWSHWVEGFDAYRLMQHFGHEKILLFYLNQVPYGAQRRGVVQGARYYFGRDLNALNVTQQLALAVLVRAPAHFDPRKYPEKLRQSVNDLAKRMYTHEHLSKKEYDAIRHIPLKVKSKDFKIQAGPFVKRVRQEVAQQTLHPKTIQSTLNPSLQQMVQKFLQQQHDQLVSRQVHQGAALVVDNKTGQILAWAVTPKGNPHDLDPVVTPRQPGSTLKPFIYALAMMRLGWQADHVLMDSPLLEKINEGTHRYRNYSGKHYGAVSLRYALGNSLNIPVLRTALALEIEPILDFFKKIGFTSLTKDAQHYGTAIALGDGEVSLFELVQAYAVLARRGEFLALTTLKQAIRSDNVSVLPSAVTSLIANILSDSDARATEFGRDSLLNFTVPTAIKTGTSSDYHDSWTVAFDDRYTVGVWFGRLDRGYMDKVTGSEGAAPVVRHIFNHLREQQPYAGLWHSPELKAVDRCEVFGDDCIQRQEWYLPASSSQQGSALSKAEQYSGSPIIEHPVMDEQLAIDPRLPCQAQRYRLSIDDKGNDLQKIEWYLNDKLLERQNENKTSILWPLQTGEQHLKVKVWLQDTSKPLVLGPIRFKVADNSCLK